MRVRRAHLGNNWKLSSWTRVRTLWAPVETVLRRRALGGRGVWLVDACVLAEMVALKLPFASTSLLPTERKFGRRLRRTSVAPCQRRELQRFPHDGES